MNLKQLKLFDIGLQQFESDYDYSQTILLAQLYKIAHMGLQ